MTRLLLIIALSSTLGCAPVPVLPDYPRDAQGYAWEYTGVKGTPVLHRDVDVYLNCEFEMHAQSCAIIRGTTCDIYLPENPQDWQEAHELKHCSGWNHPGITTS